MATNYSPTIVTDGLKYSGDPLMPSTAENGSGRLYDNVGAKSSEVKFLLSATNSAGSTFRDSSLRNHTITPYGDVTRSSTESRFNDSSIKFDGTGDYLTLADSDDWSFGDGDFTIDFWVYPTDNSTNYQGLITQVPSETSTGMWIEYNAGTLRLFVRNGSGDLFTEINGSMVKDNWHHVAVVRKENTMYLFKDGYSQGSSSYSGTWPNFSAPVYIGYRNGYNHFNGYMDQIRIVKGTALYDTTFVPPTRPSNLDLYDAMMYTANQLDFDGTDDKVSYGDVTWIDGATNITFACWVYLEGSPPGAGGVLLSKDNALECWVKQSSSDQFVMSINNNHVAFDSDAPEIRLWTHVAMTWNSTGDVRKLYLNGQLKSTKTTGTQSGNSINNTSEGLAIGSRDGNNYEINGQISDVRLFNKTLDAAQIKQICNNPKVIVPDNLSISDYVFYAPLSEGTGTDAYDASGRQRNGTLTGADWVTGRSGANQLITGYNRPLKFASGDYVNVPVVGGSTGPLAIGTNDFTVCGWWFGDPSQTQGPNLFMQFAGAGGWRLVATSSPAYRFSIFDNGWSNYAYKDVSVTLGTWQHIAVSCDRDGTAVCYLNGSASGSALDISSVTGSLTNSDPLRIGNGNYTNTTPSSDWTYGVINECMIFNGIALNATDIAALAATDANGGPLPPDPRTMSFNTSGYSTSHLKGYWRNTGNSTWTDDSGNSNTGTVYGGSKNALTFIEGYNGNKNVNSGRDSQGFPLKHKNVGAAGFNGSDTSIRVSSLSTDSNSAGILASENLTISVWVKPIDKDSPTLQGIVTNNSTGTGRRDLDISSGVFQWRNGLYANVISSSSAQCKEGEWQHLVVTSQTVGSAALMKMFIDGDQVAEESRTDTIPVDYATNGFYLGYLNSSRYFNGQIGPVQVYDRALTLKEIRQNYNAQKSRFT